MSERYWGGYCSQCNVWIRRPDASLLYYPSSELMRADLTTELGSPGILLYRPHLFEVTEFGKECPLDREHLSEGSAVCSVITEELQRKAFSHTYDARMND